MRHLWDIGDCRARIMCSFASRLTRQNWGAPSSQRPSLQALISARAPQPCPDLTGRGSAPSPNWARQRAKPKPPAPRGSAPSPHWARQRAKPSLFLCIPTYTPDLGRAKQAAPKSPSQQLRRGSASSQRFTLMLINSFLCAPLCCMRYAKSSAPPYKAIYCFTNLKHFKL